ncbi:ankyrin repeat domain-containing protein 12 isoform X3 [Erpetoichthys calabaricus]|uniref:Ankyrin repeat domain 12 n=1 Tax=Erpetoichthys calabaricus TaxID=27687 RepID=A0A8C4S0D4_ERPCA|nr:ankyrin repeat domain-containing protein 12 isoform X3 [Erpetoichthys calabaricus]
MLQLVKSCTMAKPGIDRESTMVEKQSGKKGKEKVSAFTKTPKLDRSELLGKEMKQKSSMKRKLPFTVSPTRNEDKDSDTDSDPGHTNETWGERLIPPCRTYSEKDGPEKKKVKKEAGGKKSTPVNILFGYPLSERKQMALLMQMTARDNSPDSTPNHPTPTTPVQKKIPSTSSRQKDKVNKRNERGETPLHMAAIRGDVKQVKELISLGADVNVKDFAGWTPLHEACNMGYYEVAKVLIAAGAEVNTQGLDNDTPLHDASSSGHKDIVKLLLRNRGDPFQANNRGERPVDVAETEELEQLLKGEIPLSEDDSSSDSEDPSSVNPSSVDDNIEDSDGEKDINNKLVTPNKQIVAGLDEYEFKDDDDDDDEEEDLNKALNDRHLLRRELRQREREQKGRNNYIAKSLRTDQHNICKSKKHKPSRVLFCNNESSDEEERKVTSPSSSIATTADGYKTDLRTKKDFPSAVEHKEKSKVKRKFKNQSKNKENQELKDDGKENTKLSFFPSLGALETSSERSKEEDTFKMSFSPKDDTSVHLFHLPSVKSPKINHSITEKQTVPLKQENTKTCFSPSATEMSLSLEVVHYDHYTDADTSTESSSSKSFKHKEKSKHHHKDISIIAEDTNLSPKKDDDQVTFFDSSEGVLRKADRDGKIIKKHKLKHKEKGKEKSKKDHEGEKDKHRQRECSKDLTRNLEFDREFWKENFFKSDENDEPLQMKCEIGQTCAMEKLSDKSAKEEKVTKEKHLNKDKRVKEDRDKEKLKRDKKENLFKDDKEDRNDKPARDRETEEIPHGFSLMKDEQEQHVITDRDMNNDQELDLKATKERNEKKSPVKEKDSEKLDKKQSEKDRKNKGDHNTFEKNECSDSSEKLKDRDKSIFSCYGEKSKEGEKPKTVLSIKKQEENKKNKEKLERKHDKEKMERERFLVESKDKDKNIFEKKSKLTDRGCDISKYDRMKEKEHDKKKKDKIRDVSSSVYPKVSLEEKKNIVTESIKACHEKALSLKEKPKDEAVKISEKDRREKDREIDRYKERDKHKDKTQIVKPNKLKTNESEVDKLKLKPSPVAKDMRPKEKRLVNDDLMQTSFERMLSLKDLEIEQWHRKHKEKIKQKERDRMRHRPGVEVNKQKIKDRSKSSPSETFNNKELFWSKSTDGSETHNNREKVLKDATSTRSYSLDAKCLLSTGKANLGTDCNLTRSPRPDNEKSNLISRSVSMTSMTSSEDSCQIATTVPRPGADIDSDFAFEASDAPLPSSQPSYFNAGKSPVINEKEKENESGILELSQEGKSMVSSTQQTTCVRLTSADDSKLSVTSSPLRGEDRKQAIWTYSDNEHKCTERTIAPVHESQDSQTSVHTINCNTAADKVEGGTYIDDFTCHSSLHVPQPVLETSHTPTSIDFASLQSENLKEVSRCESENNQNAGIKLQKMCRVDLQPMTEAISLPLQSVLIEKPNDMLSSDHIKQENISSMSLKESEMKLSHPAVLQTKVQHGNCIDHLEFQPGTCEERPELLEDGYPSPRLAMKDQICVKISERTLSPSERTEDQNTELGSPAKPDTVKLECCDSQQLLCPVSTVLQESVKTVIESSSRKTVANNILKSDVEVKSDTYSHTGIISSNFASNVEMDASSTNAHHTDKSSAAVKISAASENSSDMDEKAKTVLENTEFLSKNNLEELSLEEGTLDMLSDTTCPMQTVAEIKTEAVEFTSEETGHDDKLEQDISYRITRTRANSQASQLKCTSAQDSDSPAYVKTKNKLTDEEEIQVHHPRKRKMPRVPQPVQVNPSLQQAKEKTQQSLAAIVDSLKLEDIEPYQTDRANPYYEFLHIRKKIEEKRKVLCSVIPQAPQYYDEYVTFNGSYLLDGNPLSKLCIPTITPPPSLLEPLKELFKQQELVRMKLRLQHSIERDKLTVSNEQEVLRVHYRAARTLANQTLPFSACTVLLDAEVYNMPHDSQTDDNKTSVRDRFNARQFMSWLQDVDDKFDKLKTCLLMRQQHEAAALNAVQRLEWQLKLQELDPATYKSISIFEIPEFYVPLVDVNDDFELTPI